MLYCSDSLYSSFVLIVCCCFGTFFCSFLTVLLALYQLTRPLLKERILFVGQGIVCNMSQLLQVEKQK